MFARQQLGVASKSFSKFLALVCVLVLALSLGACGPAPESSEPEEEQKQEESQGKQNEDASANDNSSDVTEEKVSLGLQPSSLLRSYSTDFVVTSLKTLYSSDDNMMFSPYNFARALTTVGNGADGDTLSQMLNAMGYSSLEDADDNIQGYMASIKKASQLSLASSIWIRDTYTLNEENAKAISDYFGVDINSGAFDSKTVQEVNKWAKDNSDGHIEKVLKSFGDKSDMALIDIGIFDGKWAKAFNSLERLPFHGTLGDKETQFMELTEGTTYDGSNFSAVGLEYEGGRFSFIGILPDGDLGEFIDGMSSGTFDSAISSSVLVVSSDAKVLLPKFSADWSSSLVDTAKSLGIEAAFDPETADFTDLITAPIRGLAISNIIQKNYIDVNQEGVSIASKTEDEEDSAMSKKNSSEEDISADDSGANDESDDIESSFSDDATEDRNAEDVSGDSASSENESVGNLIFDEDTEVVFDRPFLYVIYDNWAEEPVFLGTVVNF